jgi:outer membrane protein
MRPLHRTTLLLLPLLATACAVDQQEDVDLWRRQVSLGDLPPFTPGQPLPMATAVRLANEQNEQIAIEGEQFLQAIIERARITAGFFPTVELAPTFTFREKSASGIPFLDDPTLLDVPVRAQLNLFEGFRRVHETDAATLTIEQRQSLLLDLRETVVLEVVQAYYRVLRAESRVVVLETFLAVQEQRVRENTARQRLGTGRSLDVAQAQAQASRTALDLLTARNEVRNGRQALSLLVGADVTQSPLHDDFALPAERPDVAALFTLAEARRQDLRAAALAAEAARARVEVAFGQYYPTVGVNLDWFLSRDSLPVDRGWTGLLFLELPLFTAGRIHADVRETWSRFRQDVLRYWQLRRQIRHDLAVALDQVATLDQSLAELANQIRASAEALRQSEVGARAGLSTNLDVIVAQQSLQRAQVDVAEAELDRKAAWLLTLRLTGALTAGTLDVAVPEPPASRPAPESPFVRVAR